MFELPAGHHGVEDGCGVMDYDDLTKKGKKRDAETIAKIMESDFKFNEGLYQRALMIMDSADDGFTFCIPLKLLHCFFSLDCIYPQKRIINIDMELNGDNKNLIKPETHSDNYELTVSKICLDLAYVTYENAFKLKWYSSINNSMLTRAFPCEKVTHHTLSNSTMFHYVPNIIPFGIFPRAIVIAFIDEKIHKGMFANSYVYTHKKLKTIQVFKNGVGHQDNDSMANMNMENMWTLNCFQWYSRFLKVMPNCSDSVSYEKFYKEQFVYCIDLSSNPSSLMKDSVTKERYLDLLTSGSLDINFQFSELPQDNLVVKIIALHTQVANFDASGELMSDD